MGSPSARCPGSGVRAIGRAGRPPLRAQTRQCDASARCYLARAVRTAGRRSCIARSDARFGLGLRSLGAHSHACQVSRQHGLSVESSTLMTIRDSKSLERVVRETDGFRLLRVVGEAPATKRPQFKPLNSSGEDPTESRSAHTEIQIEAVEIGDSKSLEKTGKGTEPCFAGKAAEARGIARSGPSRARGGVWSTRVSTRARVGASRLSRLSTFSGERPAEGARASEAALVILT